MGDTVEAGVLRRVYPAGVTRSASKGVVGHLLGAAWTVGLLRLIGALEPGGIRAVSSFRFGGTNAHSLLERPLDGGELVALTVPAAGERHWLGELPAAGWVHRVHADPAGGSTLGPYDSGPPVLRVGGRYLVTGASGGLGRVFCRWLDRRYGAELLLVSRHPDPAQLAGLRRADGLAADLATPTGGAALAGRRPWDGVFHLAGGLGAQGLMAKTARLRTLAAQESGFLCLFSSVSALMPGLGVAEYSQANQALARFARQALGLVVSVAWGPGSGVGLAAEQAEAYAERGLAPVAPAPAVRALGLALRSGHRHVAVLSRPDPVVVRTDAPAADREGLRQVLADAAELALEAAQDGLSLPGLGMDSVQRLDLVEDLEGAVGRDMPTTLLYDNATVGALLNALSGGLVRLPAPPRTSWDQVAAALRQVTQGAADWWREHFRDGVPPLNLAWAGPVSPPAHGPPETAMFQLSQRETAACSALADGRGLTLPVVVLAAYARAHFDATGRHQVVVRIAQR